MKYRLASPVIDAQIAEILRKLRLSMNGIVSDHMTQNGIIYKKNYGVSIPRIKEIATQYTPNDDLALQLWNLQIRETMILATLLVPVDSLTPELADEWVDRCNQIEIVEQACMNLFSKLPFADSLCLEWVSSGKDWKQITGFTLGARIFKLLNASEVKKVIEIAVKNSDTNNFFLYKAVALCLSRFCRINKETTGYIQKEIDVLSGTTSVSQHYIWNEVHQEILFLSNL